jgi:hypothetical protein
VPATKKGKNQDWSIKGQDQKKPKKRRQKLSGPKKVPIKKRKKQEMPKEIGGEFVYVRNKS